MVAVRRGELYETTVRTQSFGFFLAVASGFRGILEVLFNCPSLSSKGAQVKRHVSGVFPDVGKSSSRSNLKPYPRP